MTQHMFNKIAKRYDFLNHLFSARFDVYWRKQAANALKKYNPKMILDVATGTADLAIACSTLQPEKITGIDFSKNMLVLGNKKIKRKSLSDTINLEQGDAQKLRFDDGSFDAVTIGFGVRNFDKLEQSIQEVHRVLKKSKQLVILELSKPRKSVFYDLYTKRLMPCIAGLFSDKKAYRYLQKSTYKFMFGKKLIQKIESLGFRALLHKKMTFGICHLYVFEKK